MSTQSPFTALQELFTPLEEIFREAQSIVAQKKVKNAAPQAEKIPEPAAIFSNPDNWRVARAVLLIHQETQTLLGHFDELVHRTVPDARRLVRSEDQAVRNSAVEYVSGAWWLFQETVKAKANPHYRKITVFLPKAHLWELGVYSYDLELTVRLLDSGILRAEAEVETVWTHDGEGAAHFIILPPGVDIYRLLSRETKIDLFNRTQQTGE